MSDDFNMSMRKFLKQVGVTSQQAIEEAMRENGARPLLVFLRKSRRLAMC